MVLQSMFCVLPMDQIVQAICVYTCMSPAKSDLVAICLYISNKQVFALLSFYQWLTRTFTLNVFKLDILNSCCLIDCTSTRLKLKYRSKQNKSRIQIKQYFFFNILKNTNSDLIVLVDCLGKAKQMYSQHLFTIQQYLIQKLIFISNSNTSILEPIEADYCSRDTVRYPILTHSFH